MTGYLYAHKIRIFDYVKFAEPLRQAIREKAEEIAKENGLEIEFIRKIFKKFISAIDTPDAGLDNLHRLTETQHENDRRYKGFNLLSEEDSSLFRLLLHGEFVINGLSNKDLDSSYPEKTPDK